MADRNLLLAHAPGSEHISDWLAIKRHIDETAPDIETRILSKDTPANEALAWLQSRPAMLLAFSMLKPPPLKARIYVCREIDKLEQSRILSSAGLPHPRTVPLIPGLKLRPEVWGEFVIVKPTLSQVGRGVRLVRTERLAELTPTLMNTGGVQGPRIVQGYIDHTDETGRLSDYRCLMLFGTPLYLHKRRRQKRLRALAEIADTLSPEIASNASGTERSRQCVFDEEVIELSRQVCRQIPDHLVALDIGRDRRTGRLVVFEMNTEGNWHFSSPHARKSFSAALLRDTYRQFNALETAARRLIEKTRAEAR
jgi:hypothetical protein